MVPLRINEALTPLSLPNSINIYIDPRGTLFGAALLCFTLPALLVESVIDHYSVDLRWECHGNLLSDRVSAEILLHSTPPGLVRVDRHTSLPVD